jgi:5S rRNA maturation endonuclease (ribonuclease M5)
MEKKSLGYGEAKRILITEYLSRLGVEPVKIRGNEYWYHSPFREDKTPSFKVNNKRNLWFDHGVGKGGTILDLGVEIHGCSIRTFINRLVEGNFIALPQQKFIPEKPGLQILSIDEIKDPELIKYLESRGIEADLARHHCVEATFEVRSGTYKAIAFPNNSQGFELRNNWFKGSSSPKDISLVGGTNQSVCVVEGFFDFLSLKQITEKRFRLLTSESSFLVLNSLSFLDRAIPVLKQFSDVNLFLDNDVAGVEARKKLTEQGITFGDASLLFPYHKDVNEYLWEFQRRKRAALKRKGVGR